LFDAGVPAFPSPTIKIKGKIKMAQGPDPNRETRVDRDLSGNDERSGGGVESPSTTRLGLSSGMIAILVVILVVVLFLVF
jgi:hypothetical protein